MTAYIGDGILLTETAAGHPIYLESSDTSITPSLVLKGDWEPWIAKALTRALKPGMRVVDIGANCGPHALLAAHAVGPKGEVIAIDANPRMASLMRRTFAANTTPWAKAVHGAVMETEGEVVLGIPDEMTGSASVWIQDGAYPAAVTTLRAPGAPLRTYLGDDLRLDLLKIDTEGAEPVVLNGARDVIEGNRDLIIFMEWAPPMQRGFCPPREFLERIRGWGFSVYEIERTGALARRNDNALVDLDWTELVLARSEARF